MQRPPLEHRACDRDDRGGGRLERKSAVFFLSLQTACSQEDTVKDVRRCLIASQVSLTWDASKPYLAFNQALLGMQLRLDSNASKV